MNFVDILFIAVIAFFVIRSFKKGFAKSILGLLAVLGAIASGAVFSKRAASYLGSSFVGIWADEKVTKLLENGENELVLKIFGQNDIYNLLMLVISFVLVFILSYIVLLLICAIIQKILKLPGLRFIDGIVGAIFGFLTGVFFCFIIYGALLALSVSNSFIDEQIANSMFFNLFNYKNFANLLF